jgi:hypothetical protein
MFSRHAGSTAAMPQANSPSRMRKVLLLAWPLLSVVIPNLVIGYGFVIPDSCIAGFNELTVGYAMSIIGYIPAYCFGLYAAYKLGIQGRTAAAA